ncbi:hypothetical protein [Alloactinosynnema sp. L-07]|uniref:hypothetical protein n=1 Tax=Alloactinosynnema sp. L-07 TaxID=1653480 RepID=UPI00065EF74B|nr:hypothetical protein [Alloactinosynnema sp. L-07]CRK56680.1 hypothetical protein [Alloactinosynnema sp. L-07]
MTATLDRRTRQPIGSKHRHRIGIVLIVAVIAAVSIYIGLKSTPEPQADAQRIDLGRPGTLLYVDAATSRVHQAPLTEPDRAIAGDVLCQRVHAAAGTMACLRADGAGATDITVYDRDLRERLALSEWGLPSRTRVSPSGRLIAWTVFRSGDSYLSAGMFSTTTGIYDLTAGQHYGSLEDFAVRVGGTPYTEQDVNFWGVTFTDDDRIFFATMSSRGKTWLIRGDITTRTLDTVRENVECPSLSPDGTRIAYKFRTGDRWRLHVLNLATGADVALADSAHLDDQALWLDNDTVAYARPHDDRPAIHTVPADGSGSPELLLPAASSPAIIGLPAG